MLALIDARKYFVLHAPRQTGTGCYRALYVNVEAAQAARDDVESGMRAILAAIASQARSVLKDSYRMRSATAF